MKPASPRFGEMIAINVGNTRTSFARFIDGRISGKIQSVPTKELKEKDIPESSQLASACVVPKVRELLSNRRILWVHAGIVTGVDFHKADTSTLGADRIANVVSAANFADLPAVVVDFGTAVTMDFVNKEKVFMGGSIIPGRKLMRHALNDYTGQIPLVSLDAEQKVPGLNTTEAVSGGIDIGIIGAVREIIDRVKKKHGLLSLSIITTGGDSRFFLANMPEMTAGCEDFTLRGIAAIWRLNCNEN